MVTVKIRKRGKAYQLDYSVDGKRQRLQFKTKSEAVAEKKRLETGEDDSSHDLEKVFPACERKKISDGIREFISFKESRAKRKRSFQLEKYIFNHFYEASFALELDFIDEIRLTHLEQIQSVWKKKKLSNATVNRRMNSVKSFLSKCQNWGFITENPASQLEEITVITPKRELWTIDEVDDLVKDLPSWAQNFFLFLHETGCRPVEAGDLLFKDVDWNRRTARLVSFKGPNVYERPAHLSEGLYALLLSIRNKRTKDGSFREDAHVFVNSIGNKVETDVFGKVVCKVRRLKGMREGLVPYGLRHTLCTLLADLNVGQNKIMAIAGHRKAETTARYIHMDESLKNVVDLVAEHRKRLA